MKKFCQEQMTVMFRDKNRSLVAERLRQELETIQVSDQVGVFEKARKVVQHLSGQGVSCRLTGAGCSSLISYLMNFSQIDPTEHGLPYERFLNANPVGTIQFKFLANSQINRSDEDFTAILDEAACDLVTFRKETSLSVIPRLVAEKIPQIDPDFNLSSIPLNDEATFELLESGDFDGINQFEGNEIRGALPDLKPRCLTDIAAITAVQLGDPAMVPQDFNLRDYFGNAWAVFRGAQSYDVEVTVTPDAAKVITETVWHQTQTVTTQKDGSVTLKFQVDGLEEILGWVLSWTGRIKVVQPTMLRNLVIEKLKMALKMNQE